jgi:DNA-binding MarR family transcriptional regulator
MKVKRDDKYMELIPFFNFMNEPSVVKVFMSIKWYDYAINIMKLTDLAHGTVLNSIYKLEDMGLVSCRKEGRIVRLSYTENGNRLITGLLSLSGIMHNIKTQ